MAATLARIGDFCVRRRWLVLGAWLIVLVLAIGLAARFGEPLGSKLTVAGLQSTQTLDKVDQEFGGSGDDGRVVVAAPEGQTLAAYAKVLTDFGAEPTLAPGGRIGYFAVATATAPALRAAIDGARAAGLEVEESSELAPPPDASSSPGIGLIVALVVLLVTFGSLSAAGLPLLTAVLGLGVSLEALHAATRLVAINSVAPTLAILLGLAVGIDYALFLIDRHRRQMRAGADDVRESIARATGTAGTAVFFAALTVIIALAGLAVARIGFLTQMGLAAGGAVLVAMLMALTLTPALLSFVGRRVVGHRRLPRIEVASRWAGAIVRHRGVAVVLSVLLLGALAVPVLGMRLGLPDDGSDPASATDRKAYDLIAQGFGPGANGPLLVLAPAAQAREITARLGELPDVARVLPATVKGDDALITLVPESGPNDAATATLVAKLRDLRGRTLLVTGQTAVAIDISAHLRKALPLYLALVAGFAFVLLLLVFRSVLIAVKAVLSFLLSLGAALGCTVAVFQWGWFGPGGPLLSFLPTIVIGVLFGLSMDYEMFLVSGMYEEHRLGASDPVVAGFGRGAKVVVAAGLIMIGVFGGGVAGGGAVTRPIAFALAVGVLVDAFVVRLVLVPAVISLLGRVAWWMPKPLARLMPAVDVDGTASAVDADETSPNTNGQRLVIAE